MIRFIEKKPITQGWSDDFKFFAAGSDGKKYLLRVTPGKTLAECESLFEAQRECAARISVAEGVEIEKAPMSIPIECGEVEDISVLCGSDKPKTGGVYMVYAWAEGSAAEPVVAAMSAAEQYAFGLRAGRILKCFHTIPAPKNVPDWEQRMNELIDKRLRICSECSIKDRATDCFVEYINKNRHLLKNRPQTFRHGDYHIGNFLVNASGEPIVIDFNRADFGDPWQEFNRLVWCAQLSAHFASGIVNGYFNDSVPNEFWKLLALYTCVNGVSSVPWAIRFGDEEIQVMLRQIREVCEWYNGMTREIPSWYIGVCKS